VIAEKMRERERRANVCVCERVREREGVCVRERWACDGREHERDRERGQCV
jgi:hypothetical protein